MSGGVVAGKAIITDTPPMMPRMKQQGHCVIRCSRFGIILAD
jgi:hypothetical protein